MIVPAAWNWHAPNQSEHKDIINVKALPLILRPAGDLWSRTSLEFIRSPTKLELEKWCHLLFILHTLSPSAHNQWTKESVWNVCSWSVRTHPADWHDPWPCAVGRLTPSGDGITRLSDCCRCSHRIHLHLTASAKKQGKTACIGMSNVAIGRKCY